MKFILTLIVALSISAISAQGVTLSGVDSPLSRAGNASLSSYGVSAVAYNKKKAVNGSIHLFKKWKNYAVIVTSEDQKFSLNNINLNIERNTFESKISEDSVFTFNFNNFILLILFG